MADNPEILSEESKGFLEDVRKGKPRKFVMICKGKNIVSMVVYKKGKVENRKKEAKETGKGSVFYGVVEGKGPNVTFRLSREDKFEEAPGKALVLKEFLKNETGDKYSPIYEIVDRHGPVLDPDDPLTARFLSLQTSALKACDEHPTRAQEINDLCLEIGSLLDQDELDDAQARIVALEGLLKDLLLAPAEAGPSDDAESKWKAVKAGLLPDIKTAAANAAYKDQILTLVGQATKFEKAGEFNQAIAIFEQLKLTCQAALGAPPAPPPLPESQAGQFKSRLVAILKKATPHAAAIGADLKTLAGQARGLAERGDYDQANLLLDQIDALIANAEAASSAPTEDSGAGFMDRLKTLRPLIDRLQAEKEKFQGDAKLQASEAGTLVRQAAASAKNKDFEQALASLTQAEPLLKACLASLEAGPESGTAVSEADSAGGLDAPEIWNAAQEAVGAQISSLQKALLATGDPDFKQIAEFGLNGITGGLQVELRTALFDLQQTTGDAKVAASKKIQGIVEKYHDFVMSNRIIELCDENPFDVQVSIRSTLTKALDQVQQAVASV